MSLAAPERDVFVKLLPLELSGIRKEYLIALQANVEARMNYENTARQLDQTLENNARSQQPQQLETPNHYVSTLLDLSHMQKQYEKLKIIHSYLDLLRQKETVKSDFFSIDSIRQEADAADKHSPLIESEASLNSLKNDTQTQVLMTRLEKAVLRAEESLKRERRLLEEAKAKQRNMEASDDRPAAQKSVKIKALASTRDELVGWIEEHLAKVDEKEDNPQIQVPTEGIKDVTQIAIHIEQQSQKIKKTYQDYLEARSSIVYLLSNRKTLPEVDNSRLRKRSEDPKDSEGVERNHIGYASTALPYITEHLMPVADAQTALLHQKDHLLNSLNAQKRSLNEALERLADESHLLARYPMPAVPPRFKANVAALGGSQATTSPFRDRLETTMESNITRQAQEWVFAADAARTAVNADLGMRLLRGEQHVYAAESSLGELQELIGVNNTESDDHNTDGDLWNAIESSHTTGVWADLDGAIGTSNAAP
ncbi:hypothetical protein G7Y79_00017g043950 [Physcia stellaris]|nr:hypothetical protein G7Y79_00017g043950 [Physcia stellaris]